MLHLVYPGVGDWRRASQEDDNLSISTSTAQGANGGRAERYSGVTADTIPLTSEALLAVILKSLNDDKAEDVVQIALHGKSEMADYMVIASGRSSRQVVAMADHLVDHLKQDHGRAARLEGKDTGDWVLVDVGDIVVHLFRPEVREFYQLEKMWLDPAEAAKRG
ncbi:MAG: ribosome silencing factor [Rhodobacteraceae bacterium]|nr:ribosome silencing factor [Paracoccaceae bacterium]